MKIQIKLVTAFLTLLTPLAAANESTPPNDRTHSCRVFEFEQWERDGAGGPAAKRPADAGEPRTVRLIYFLPSDRSFNADVVDSMQTRIRRIQTFYGQQMQAHGYGNRTFQFETDDQGEPLVHRVDGPYPESEYLRFYRMIGVGNVYRDLEQAFDFRKNVYFIVVDHSTSNLWDNVAGFASQWSKNGGFALVPSDFSFATAAHELGHAFGLQHDFNDGAYIMSFGPAPDRLSACSAGILAVHAYFNPDVPTAVQTPPTIDLVSSLRFPAGSTSLSVQLSVSVNFSVDVFRPELTSPDLHQVSLFVRTRGTDAAAGSHEVKSCHVLSGVQNTVVAFDYDGVIPSEGSESLSTSVTQYIAVEAVDTRGNVRQAHFLLAEESPHHIATLKGPTSSQIYGAEFSPDGSLLAVRSGVGIQIWDTAARTAIGTLSNTSASQFTSSLAFSPAGTVLASGHNTTSEANVKLWDTSNQTLIVALDGPSAVASLAFSPDGTVLASGSGDQTINLWDVAGRTLIATLEGHTSHVWSLAFSRDGTLSSGSRDGTVKLWNVTTRTNVATLEGHTGRVLDVSFSPDGSLLASSTDGGVLLWDVATGKQTATLDGRGDASFSPDGAILASGGGGYAVLWDMATKEQIATLGHAGRLRDPDGYWVDGVFSPDGSLFATAGIDGVELWNASEWTGATPVQTATDFNGDGRTDFVDFFLFADAYGGTDARFDLDGNGTVDFADFFKFVDAFGS